MESEKFDLAFEAIVSCLSYPFTSVSNPRKVSDARTEVRIPEGSSIRENWTTRDT